MKSVLIVEDNEQKYHAIDGKLKQIFPVTTAWARTVRHAYNLLGGGNTWNALVLDMTFEDAEGLLRSTSKKPLAGIEVLQFVAGSGLKLPTIVVTQHDRFAVQAQGSSWTRTELSELLQEAFPNQFLGMIRSHLGDVESDWLEEIASLLNGALA